MSYPPPPSGSPYSTPGQGYGAPPKRLRGRTPLRLGLIFLVLSIALFVIGGIIAAKETLGKVNGFSRVNIASTGIVNFKNTGNYVAYYEADDVTNSTHQVPKVPVAIQSPSGKIRQLSTLYGGRSDNKVRIVTYQYHGHNGIALWQFKITEKGTYKVQVGSNTLAASGGDIAFGTSIAAGTVASGLLILIGVLLLITAIVLLIVGVVKRSRHKKELHSGPYAGGPYPGEPYPGGPYPGGPYPGGPYPGRPPPGQKWPQQQPSQQQPPQQQPPQQQPPQQQPPGQPWPERG